MSSFSSKMVEGTLPANTSSPAFTSGKHLFPFFLLLSGWSDLLKCWHGHQGDPSTLTTHLRQIQYCAYAAMTMRTLRKQSTTSEPSAQDSPIFRTPSGWLRGICWGKTILPSPRLLTWLTTLPYHFEWWRHLHIQTCALSANQKLGFPSVKRALNEPIVLLMCTDQLRFSILSINATLNISKFCYLTPTVYTYLKLTERQTGIHPIKPGPAMAHNKLDSQTSQYFGNWITELDPRVRDVRFVGSDWDAEIDKGFRRAFPIAAFLDAKSIWSKT